MNKSKILKSAGLVALAAAMPFSAAQADAGGDNWSISGWLNEGMTWADDGVGSDIVQLTDNGTTLGSRVTLSGSQELPNSGLSAGFELILEPRSGALGFGTSTTGTLGAFDSDNADVIGVLGNSVNVSGSFGKVTVGLQSMPTDNIAVLEDPSLTLWSSISPVFRGNGVLITNGTTTANAGTSWGDFMNCYTNGGLRGNLGIGLDCNGAYLRGIRYDLPAFGPVTVAVGYANDDVFDVAAKYKGTIGGLSAQLAIGYAMNQSGGADGANIWTESENFQIQGGLMDPGTGIFGTFSYQNEDADFAGASTIDGSTDAYWGKVGIKKAFNSLGDTSFAFQYGSYNDQFGTAEATAGVTGSEVERIGFEVNQYFGSRFILYGTYENLSLDVDGTAAANTTFGPANDLDTFTAGMVFFF